MEEKRNHGIRQGDIFVRWLWDGGFSYYLLDPYPLIGEPYDPWKEAPWFYQVTELRGKTLALLRPLLAERYFRECALPEEHTDLSLRPLPGRFRPDAEVLTVRIRAGGGLSSGKRSGDLLTLAARRKHISVFAQPPAAQVITDCLFLYDPERYYCYAGPVCGRIEARMREEGAVW